jgi:hypothetical protein
MTEVTIKITKSAHWDLLRYFLSKFKIGFEAKEIKASKTDAFAENINLTDLELPQNDRKVFDKMVAEMESLDLHEELLAIDAPPQKYDFSDLVGKLEWKGDAVKQQRQLRDEW